LRLAFKARPSISTSKGEKNMVMTRFRTIASTTLAISVLLISASMALSQSQASTSSTNSRAVASGQKMKIKGVVTRRDADTFVVRDANGVDTTVRLTDRTSVKTHGGFLRGGTNYAQTNILRGLNLEAEGHGDASGQLIADKIRFNESDLRVARAVESRAAPLEERATTTENKLSQVEENARRLSG
jgi:hypothetical protein